MELKYKLDNSVFTEEYSKNHTLKMMRQGIIKKKELDFIISSHIKHLYVSIRDKFKKENGEIIKVEKSKLEDYIDSNYENSKIAKKYLNVLISNEIIKENENKYEIEDISVKLETSKLVTLTVKKGISL